MEFAIFEVNFVDSLVISDFGLRMDYIEFIMRQKIASVKKSSLAGAVYLLEAPLTSRESFEVETRRLVLPKPIVKALLAKIEDLNRSKKDVLICCGEAANGDISVYVIDIPESIFSCLEEIYSGPPDNVFSKLLKGYLPKSIRVGLISIGKHLTSGIIDEESFLTKKTLNIDFAYSASDLSKADANRLKNNFNECIRSLFVKGDESIKGLYVGIEGKMRKHLGLLEQNDNFNDEKKGIVTMDLNNDDPLEVVIKHSSQFSDFPDLALVREIRIIDRIIAEMHSESGKIVLGFEKIMDALKTGALGEIVVHEHNKSQKFLLKNISTGEQQWLFVDANKVAHVRTDEKLRILQSFGIMSVLNEIVEDYKTKLKVIREATQESVEFDRSCHGLAGIKRY